MILLHLLLLFGFRGFARDALIVSAPLVVLRVPALRRWWLSHRHARDRRVLRGAAALLLVSVFASGFMPFVRELSVKGGAAFVQNPVDD
jgi:hypothetical protein